MSETAKGGFRNEDWVVDQFNGWNAGSRAEEWLGIMGHARPKKVCAQTTRKMGFFNKADVLVLVDECVEWVSVKKFTASFNQIDKHWVKDFAKMWRMPNDVADSLRMYCGESGFRPTDCANSAAHTRDERRFFMDELSDAQQKKILSFFGKNRNQIIKDVMAGRGKGAAKWMLLVEEGEGASPKSTLLSMTEAVRHCIGPASITKRGNLRLGSITIQRKGGDAGMDTAQMLQFKFSPRELIGVSGASAF